VIGAVWKSTELTGRKPFILYGNTDEILVKNVERSREFIESQKVEKINCNVGEMALAGSTRMQSTTILMHAIGIALLGCDRLRTQRGLTNTWEEYARSNLSDLHHYFSSTDFEGLRRLIEEEADIYQKGELLSYCSDPFYAVSILTDTTERSPTFSLAAFKNHYDPQSPESWCNLVVEQPHSEGLSWEERVENDWRVLLG
jgi:N-acetylmuramic acid 6-phosphate etherase